MSSLATGVLKWDPWKPEPFDVAEAGPALMRGSVTNHYTGNLEAVGQAETLISGLADGTSSMVAVERVSGSLHGRTGTFVIQLTGTIKGGVAKVDWKVIPDSGTGDLTGLQGEGGYTTADMGTDGQAEVRLEYTLG
ncbi:DUF3224 domain-containing protein [Streptomyces sp. NPDC048441]|uniref:DUF3224 domain-containing protein n=1 Tax=Streptomyces sp. NPDC048441 TaxID=3365552 RepID=UPI003721F5EE